MADISKINPGNGTTYTIKDASALKDVSISGNTLKLTNRNDTNIASYTPVEGIYGNAINKALGTAAITKSGSYKSTIWRVDLKDVSLYDGLTIFIKVPVAGNGTYGTMLRIDGTDSEGDTNLNLYPVCTGVSSMISTRYAINTIVGLTYDSTQVGAICYDGGKRYTTTTTGTGWTKPGCWKVLSDYDSGNDRAYNLYPNYKKVYNGAIALTRYKIVAQDKDNRVTPLTVGDSTGSTKTTNTTSFRPEHIYLFNSSSTTAIAAGKDVTNGSLYSQIGYTNPAYTFNESLATYRHIYLCGDYNKETGLFTLSSVALTMADGSTTRAANLSYFTQVPTNTANINLKTYFATGKYYIYLGATYKSANYFQLEDNKPMYYFDGTNLISAAYIDNGEKNILESIKINGTALSITDKSVNIPLATSTPGVVKTTSTTASTTGLIATPIISGVPYYKDTVYTHPSKTQADTTSSATPAHGGTFTVVDSISRDSNGHVSGINVKTVTLPASGNTDEKVKQSSSTTNQFMPILGAYSATPTSGNTGQAYYNQNIAINTSTNTIKVNACQMTYDVAEDCIKFTFNN